MERHCSLLRGRPPIPDGSTTLSGDVETTHPEVRLLVPAMPEFIRLARLAAAALASRKGFTYDEVEDLRIAIDELCFTLVGTAGRDGVLVLQYSMLPEGLAI